VLYVQPPEPVETVKTAHNDNTDPPQQILEVATGTVPDDMGLEKALRMNLDYAMRVALILLHCGGNEVFTMKELFMTIAGLSYCGDNRKQFYGEDANKCEKIVNGSYDAFIELYQEFVDQYIEPLESDNNATVCFGIDGVRVDYKIKEDINIERLCDDLPGNLVKEMVEFDCEIMDNLGDGERVYKCINHALCVIVSSSSWIQTLKGVLSAGLGNSVWYMLRKMNKYFMSTDVKDGKDKDGLQLQSV